MDRTLGYLRESLSNHLEHDVCRGIYKKLQAKHYANEGEFVKDLNDLEMDALNQVLEKDHILNFQAVIAQINVTLILLNNLISAFFAFLTG